MFFNTTIKIAASQFIKETLNQLIKIISWINLKILAPSMTQKKRKKGYRQAFNLKIKDES